MVEEPVTREMVAQARADIARAIASGERRAALNIFGTEIVLEMVESGEFTFRVPNQQAAARVFAPSADIPAGYPGAMPFIAMETAISSEAGPGSRSLMWLGPAQGAQVYESLVDQSRTAGWSVDSEHDMPQIPARQTNLLRSGARRIIMISGDIVSLIERPE